MNQDIRSLEPKSLWNHFSDLNAVPRPSKKEERVIQFMVDFGKKLNLETLVDNIGNVIIKKPATKGLENRKTVVLQSHLDMVHQKNNDTIFDFETQGIEMLIDQDWVTANGTTLGADNGLGVASIMAILSSSEIEHPKLEALFTIDEETGMTGAMHLDPTILEGEILLNLDTEEDDEIGIGCAGGIDLTAKREYSLETITENFIAYKITLKGLNGGHSGMDIHKGLGNANKLMNRILFFGTENFNLKLSSLHGGSLRNAIPRESEAVILVSATKKDDFLNKTNELINTIKKEFSSIEENLEIIIDEVSSPKLIMNSEDQSKFIKAIYSALNGVYRMSPDISDLVETSNNIAKITLENGTIEVLCLTRSSSESGKKDLSNALQATFELADFSVEFSGNYPGWNPNMNSDILNVLDNLYRKINGQKAHIAACHAGLECGILGQHYPEMDMISFGPTIRGAHSPDERVSISSTQKFWSFLLEILKNIPKKQ